MRIIIAKDRAGCSREVTSTGIFVQVFLYCIQINHLYGAVLGNQGNTGKDQNDTDDLKQTKFLVE